MPSCIRRGASGEEIPLCGKRGGGCGVERGGGGEKTMPTTLHYHHKTESALRCPQC